MKIPVLTVYMNDDDVFSAEFHGDANSASDSIVDSDIIEIIKEVMLLLAPLVSNPAVIMQGFMAAAQEG